MLCAEVNKGVFSKLQLDWVKQDRWRNICVALQNTIEISQQQNFGDVLMRHREAWENYLPLGSSESHQDNDLQVMMVSITTF